MTTYTLSTETWPPLTWLLERAHQDGELQIKRWDGELFTLKSLPTKPSSPLDVPGIDLQVTSAEIVQIVREMRERDD